jgi:hypothetical protein
MKVCDNNRLPWCDDEDFEGFHLWITFVRDDSRALRGKWSIKLFKLKMCCCFYYIEGFLLMEMARTSKWQ